MYCEVLQCLENIFRIFCFCKGEESNVMCCLVLGESGFATLWYSEPVFILGNALNDKAMTRLF